MKKTGSSSRVLLLFALITVSGLGTGAATAEQAIPLESTEDVGGVGNDTGLPQVSHAYGRANEVISMTVDYLAQISTSLDQASDESEKRKILAPFCLQSLPGGGSESVDACEKRFRWYAGSALARAKVSLATNSESAEELKDSRQNVGVGREVLAGKGGASVKPVTPVLPYAPRYASLQAARAVEMNRPEGQAALEKYLASPEFENEVRRSLQPRPSPDDFIEMEQRMRADGEVVLVPKRDAQGHLVKNQTKYLEALREYDDSMRDVQIEPSLLQQIEGKEVQIKKNTLRDDVMKFATDGGKAVKDGRSREATIKRNYDVAHDSAVGQINASLNRGKSVGGRLGSSNGGLQKIEALGEKKVVAPADSLKSSRSVSYEARQLEDLRTAILKPVKVKRH